jgi:hypothetical protein
VVDVAQPVVVGSKAGLFRGCHDNMVKLGGSVPVWGCRFGKGRLVIGWCEKLSCKLRTKGLFAWLCSSNCLLSRCSAASRQSINSPGPSHPVGGANHRAQRSRLRTSTCD